MSESAISARRFGSPVSAFEAASLRLLVSILCLATKIRRAGRRRRRGGRQRLGQSEVLPNAGSYVVRTAAGGSSTGCVIVQASPSGQPALSSRSMSCTSAELLAMFAASSASAPRLIIRCVRQLISAPSSTRMITVSEERRVGKECRYRRSRYHEKNNRGYAHSECE